MLKKKTLICKQNIFGGTDLLLTRYEKWLKKNEYVVEYVEFNKLSTLKNTIWDVVILPTSEINQLYLLHKNKIVFKGIIIYILGMGTMRDSYFNPGRNGFFDRCLRKYLVKISNQFLDYLYKSNSIIFTDSVGLYNNFIGTDIKFNIDNIETMLVPIGIEIPKICHVKEKREKIIRCCWIGRVSKDFKMKSILNLINDLDEMNRNYNIKLTIIGDGDGLEEVKLSAKLCKYEIDFINNIHYENLNLFFSKNIDLCIAMGTSALDSAKIGIPTIIISPIREFDTESANYRWIFESKGYSLGEYVGEKNYTNQIKRKLQELLDEFENDETISKKCKKYSMNFDDDLVFSKLVNYNNCDLNIELIKHVRRFYYLKNSKKKIKKYFKRKE